MTTKDLLANVKRDASLQSKMIAVKRSLQQDDAAILKAALPYGEECFEAGMRLGIQRVWDVLEGREAA